MKRLVKRQLCKFSRTNNREDREKYVNDRREYKRLLMKKKTEFDEERLTQLKQYFNNPSKFWETVRSINRKSTIYNSITSEQWYEHFSGVFNTFDSLPEEEDSDDVMEDEAAAGVFDEPIFRDEVTASIRNLKLGKSAGLDKIVSEMLKYVDQIVADFLVQLFNKLYDEGIFPKEWSKSIIVPIHKKGDANIPDNYRGIALTSVLSKVYTHILNKRLTGWAEQEEKILEQQAGFRAG